jgi:hypothetical protein
MQHAVARVNFRFRLSITPSLKNGIRFDIKNGRYVWIAD